MWVQYDEDVSRSIITCGQCGMQYELKIWYHPGFADHAEIKCEQCGYSFGEYRVDDGYLLTPLKGKGK